MTSSYHPKQKTVKIYKSRVVSKKEVAPVGGADKLLEGYGVTTNLGEVVVPLLTSQMDR